MSPIQLSSRLALATAFGLATFAAGCGDDGGGGQPTDAGVDAPDGGDGLTLITTLPGVPQRDLDVLFVIDNSGSMAEEQNSLAAAFPTFVNELNRLPGGLPNLHLGVVSTNMGTGGVQLGGCSSAARPSGDDGQLLTNGCANLTGSFVSDLALADGSRSRNYSGDLAPLFTCMARLGTAGCGFEQPLEAMHRALQPGQNPGFLRPGAQLAVVILTDEDDCSALPGGALFGDPNAGPSSVLGPRTSFRCFEFGVACANDPNPRAFGARTGCGPRPASPYMHEVGRYVDFVRALKADPDDVTVAIIQGSVDEAGTAVVEPDPSDATRPALAASCTSSVGAAFPGFRLAAFLDGFPDRSGRYTVCNDNQQDAAIEIGQQINASLGDPCIGLPLADTDPQQPGVQVRCEVTDVIDTGSGRIESPIAACDAGALPCWRLAMDPVTCSQAPDALAIAIDRGGITPPAGVETEVRCQVEAGP